MKSALPHPKNWTQESWDAITETSQKAILYDDLERELQEAVELLRPASAPELFKNKEAACWEVRRDAFLARQKGAAS